MLSERDASLAERDARIAALEQRVEQLATQAQTFQYVVAALAMGIRFAAPDVGRDFGAALRRSRDAATVAKVPFDRQTISDLLWQAGQPLEDPAKPVP